MAVTTAVNLFGGPAYVLIGDPTQAAGAGLVELAPGGDSGAPRAEITLEFFRQIHQNELNQQLADGVFRSVKGGQISLQLFDSQISILAAMYEEIEDNTTSISFDPAYVLRQAPSLIVVPIASYGKGKTDRGIWYFPAVTPLDPSAFIYKTEESDNTSEPYTVPFRALRTPVDLAGQALNTKYQIVFKGDPDDALASPSGANLWELPAGYSPSA